MLLFCIFLKAILCIYFSIWVLQISSPALSYPYVTVTKCLTLIIYEKASFIGFIVSMVSVYNHLILLHQAFGGICQGGKMRKKRPFTQTWVVSKDKRTRLPIFLSTHIPSSWPHLFRVPSYAMISQAGHHTFNTPPCGGQIFKLQQVLKTKKKIKM